MLWLFLSISTLSQPCLRPIAFSATHFSFLRPDWQHLSLSLSLSIYIYIFFFLCMYMHMYLCYTHPTCGAFSLPRFKMRHSPDYVNMDEDKVSELS